MKDNDFECCPGSKSLTLFGFDLWFMVGILAGGGALVLLLMIVLVTLACRSCKRRARQQQGMVSLRFCETIIISCNDILLHKYLIKTMKDYTASHNNIQLSSLGH